MPDAPRVGGLRDLGLVPAPEDGVLDLQRFSITDVAIAIDAAGPMEMVEIVGCEVVGLRILSTGHGVLRLRDSRLRRCDLVGLRSVETVVRCTLADSKLSGSTFAEARLSHVVFTACVFPQSNWRSTRLRHVVFRDCDLREGDFGSAELEGVMFERCDLAQARFNRARLTNVDLRSSAIDTVIAPSSLRGATISTDQALGLAGALAADIGFIVNDA